MCGFVAIANLRDWADDLAGATDALAHRGPDARSLWTSDDHEGKASPHCELGHRRLAVIDLDAGQQPMTSACGRYVIAYNGELYNFPELRRELERGGLAFRTQSDTEVMLESLAAWGTEALQRFDGIFALALWDRQDASLLLARDRLGVKPLYYAAPSSGSSAGLAAASELSALMAFSQLPRRINDQAVRDYLCQEFIDFPATILRDVHQLEPGSWCRFDAQAGTMARETYWRIPPATTKSIDPKELVEAVDDALRKSVAKQLVSDVPLGVLFSGGIDSALLTHYAQESLGKPVKTYTVKFDQSARHDEAPIAAVVAQAMGTDHHELRAGDIDADGFRAACAYLDQPFGDASFLPVSECCALARADITVALGGDGGDEIFGGYPRYLKDAASYPDAPWWGALRGAVERGWLPASLYRSAMRGNVRIQRHYSRMQAIPVTTRSVTSILTPEAAQRCHADQAMERWLEAVRSWTGKLDADSLMRSDAHFYLCSNGLVKTDRASMRHGLEARVPMLGNDVVDLMLEQPAPVKFGCGDGSGAARPTSAHLKAILKTLAERHLPRAAWDRPKRGFTVPIETYLFDTWRPYTQTLIDRLESLAPSLNAKEIRRRWTLHLRGEKVDWPVYAVVALLGWLDTHGMSW